MGKGADSPINGVRGVRKVQKANLLCTEGHSLGWEGRDHQVYCSELVTRFVVVEMKQREASVWQCPNHKRALVLKGTKKGLPCAASLILNQRNYLFVFLYCKLEQKWWTDLGGGLSGKMVGRKTLNWDYLRRSRGMKADSQFHTLKS